MMKRRPYAHADLDRWEVGRICLEERTKNVPWKLLQRRFDLSKPTLQRLMAKVCDTPPGYLIRLNAVSEGIAALVERGAVRNGGALLTDHDVFLMTQYTRDIKQIGGLIAVRLNQLSQAEN